MAGGVFSHLWLVVCSVIHDFVQIGGGAFSFSSKQQQLILLQSGVCIWQLQAPHCKHVTTVDVTLETPEMVM